MSFIFAALAIRDLLPQADGSYLVQFCRQCAQGRLEDDVVLVHFAVKHLQHAARIKRQERDPLDLHRQQPKLNLFY